MPHATAEKRRAWYKANEASAQRSRESSLAAKRRRRGACEDCGAETRYAGHESDVSRWCRSCAATHVGAALRGRGPMQARLYALLRERGELRYMEITRELGVSTDYAGALLNSELSAGRIERPSRGVYRLPLDSKRGEDVASPPAMNQPQSTS